MKNNRLHNFLESIRGEYEESRIVRVNIKEKGRKTTYVVRGRNRCISSIAEDYFAMLLWRTFKSTKITIFVDQPISLSNRKQPYYPDIVVCKTIKKNEKYEILFMIDLKMDVNWHKNSFLKNTNKLEAICKKMKNAKELRGKKGNVIGEKKGKLEFVINPKASYDEVIINSKNSIKNRIKMLEASKNKNINLWVLSKGQHPNSYKYKKDMEPNDDDYNNLIKKMKRIIDKSIG